MSGPRNDPPSVFQFDGQPVPLQPGDTILQAAQRAGHDVPHLCWHPEVSASASCRVCTVHVDGRPVAACTTAAAAGQTVDCHTAGLRAQRLRLLQMLFVEGNHFCPGCEKSGNCLLQATAYQMGMEGPHFEEFYPDRPVDASHPDLLLDFNRCILCELCVRASAEVDGKQVFALAGRGMGEGAADGAGAGRGATGARIISQAVKELDAMPKGQRAIVSICADGGQGTVAGPILGAFFLAPLAELAGYQLRLNAITAGQGRYTIELSHYDAVPPAVQQQLVDLGGEVLLQMPSGSKWEVTLPADKAYGADPRTGFPPNVAVQFELKLVSVK